MWPAKAHSHAGITFSVDTETEFDTALLHWTILSHI